MVRKNILGSGPFKFAGLEIGQSIKGVRNSDYYHPGLPYLDGFVGIYADKQAVRAAALRSDRVPWVSAVGPRRTCRRARQRDHCPGKRLELRQPNRAQPQVKTV